MTENSQAQRAKASLQAKLVEDSFNDPQAVQILRKMAQATMDVDALLGTHADFMLEEPAAVQESEDEEFVNEEESASEETLQLMRSLLAVLHASVNETDDQAQSQATINAIGQLVQVSA